MNDHLLLFPSSDSPLFITGCFLLYHIMSSWERAKQFSTNHCTKLHTCVRIIVTLDLRLMLLDFSNLCLFTKNKHKY